MENALCPYFFLSRRISLVLVQKPHGTSTLADRLAWAFIKNGQDDRQMCDSLIREVLLFHFLFRQNLFPYPTLPGFFWSDDWLALLHLNTISIPHTQMSTASKATFAASCLFAVGSFIYINVEQRNERNNLRQGPIKDAERMRLKMSKKQMANEREHQEQLALKTHYEKVQPLNLEVIRGEE